MIQLFDMVGSKPVPSAHCHVIRQFKTIIDEYPEDYLQIFAYILYTTCLDPGLNPYQQLDEAVKEDVIIADIGPLRFSPEDEHVLAAINKAKQLYETPVDRSFLGAKVMLDKISKDMIHKELTYGQKDGNATIMKGFMERLPSLWKAYKEMTVNLLEEQSIARGKVRRAYDQLPTYKNIKDEGTQNDSGEQDSI